MQTPANKPLWIWSCVLCVALTCGLAHGQTPSVELLWPDGAPGAKGKAEGDKPNITVYLPAKDKANGAAVVICPGGGYGGLAIDHEGKQVAEWLNSIGVAGFILQYRHRGVGYGHPAPLQDAQRAVRMVRARSNQWGVDLDRIGILGFSAGGHLASSAATYFDNGRPDDADPIERASCRPDFVILIYPVITLTESFVHAGSRQNLLGKEPDPKLMESLSNEKQVTSQTPPAFLVHTDEDKGVPVENSLAFYQAMRKVGVPAELHVYTRGDHGFGLGRPGEAHAAWPGQCANWLRSMKFTSQRLPSTSPSH